jgi:Protein of unknown function (DUF2750)
MPMTWDVNDQEFESVLSLPAPRRYEYLIKRSAGHGELWGLHRDGGWVMAEDDDGTMHFPIWPHRRFAEACAAGPWEDAAPRRIDIDEWVAGWLPDLISDRFRIAVFQTPQDQGVGVSPQRFKHDLEEELSLFEL